MVYQCVNKQHAPYEGKIEISANQMIYFDQRTLLPLIGLFQIGLSFCRVRQDLLLFHHDNVRQGLELVCRLICLLSDTIIKMNNVIATRIISCR